MPLIEISYRNCVFHPLGLHGGKFVTDKKITEAKLRQIIRLSLSDIFSDWLTTEQAWFEIVRKAVDGKTKNGEKSAELLG